jgi:thiamine biosynthesis lipoprotein
MHSTRRTVLLLSCVVFAFSTTVSCRAKEPARTEFALGTVCTVNLYERGTKDAYDEIFARLRELERTLSANDERSNVSAINRSAGIAPVAAEPDTVNVLSAALAFSEKTGGAFDPAIGPLVRIWNIGNDRADVPAAADIEKALALVSWKDIILDRQKNTVFLAKKGMRIDLGAIAKGYAADEVVGIVERRGIKRAMIDLGGNIYAVGEKAPGTPWVIGIRDPKTSHGLPVASLRANSTSIVTSGIFERYFEKNGVHYHHILDPQTGYPKTNELLSVTIVARSSMNADALSTSAFLLGTERGLALVASVPGAEAIFIDRQGRITASPGLKGAVTVLDDGYTLAE